MEQLRYLKDSAFTLLELMLVRVKMARIELSEFKDNLVKAIAMLLVALFIFFLSFISLLFALNTLLTDEQKIWVFFGIAAGCFLLTLVLFLFALSKLHSNDNFMQETLQGISDDIQIAKGKKPLHDLKIKELFDDE
ncbi:MAG: phage holin family protein [Nitrosomonas sp. PRO4]|nr:phage holin family protein [Nitrosomonas sp. PRO4]